MNISQETAKRIYPTAPAYFKKELEAEFGEEAFKVIDFTDIKTLEDACKYCVIDPLSVSSSEDTSDEAAYKKLKIISKAINQGWEPDWNNRDQKKWAPYFNLSSGFGFVVSLYYYVYSDASVGSRLCFESKKKADHAGRQFGSIYKEFLTITK